MAVVHLFCTVVLVAIGQNWGDCNITRRGQKKTTDLRKARSKSQQFTEADRRNFEIDVVVFASHPALQEPQLTQFVSLHVLQVVSSVSLPNTLISIWGIPTVASVTPP